MLDFLQLGRTGKDRTFAVRKQFLEDLVAAKAVGADSGGDIATERLAVETNVESRVTESRQHVPDGGAFVPRCRRARRRGPGQASRRPLGRDTPSPQSRLSPRWIYIAQRL